MKKNKIEKNLRASLSDEKRAVWSRVEGELFDSTPVLEAELATNIGSAVSVGNKKKRTLAIALASVMLFMVMLFGIIYPVMKNDRSGYIYIDINPSVQITVGRNGKVSEVLSLNEDALVMLSSLKEEDYIGKKPEEITVLIWEKAYDSGYVSPLRTNNAILISGEFKDSAKTDEMNEKLKNSVNAKVKEFGVYCAVLTELQEDVLKPLADLCGITTSKYRLILDAISVGADISFNEFDTIKISEIHQRMNAAVKEKQNGMSGSEWQEIFDKHHEKTEQARTENEGYVKPDDFDNMFDEWEHSMGEEFKKGWNDKRNEWRDEMGMTPPPPKN